MSRPQRYVTDYTPEEQVQFQQAFRALLERHRYYPKRITYSIGAYIALSFVFFTNIFPEASLPIALLGYIIGFLALLLVLILYVWRSLKCPACHNCLDWGFGDYCPECGNKALQQHMVWWNSGDERKCASCSRTLQQFEGARTSTKSYRIRACTYCGVKLDERGV